jgi:pyruvate/2-oxoglutarate dehydrogenase complex dihydrolipoamide dehydrogenase (E3) component
MKQYYMACLDLEGRRCLVVGGGAVGLEFGQVFSRFGSKVTIVDALERIAPTADMEASAMLRMALEREGIDVATSVFVKSVRRDGDEVAATIAPRDGYDEYEVRVERVMLASGRVPNIEARPRRDRVEIRIVVDDHLRTTVRDLSPAT